MPVMKKPAARKMPVLPLRGLMVFPHMVLHFDVGRQRSIAALEQAMLDEQDIFLVAQLDAEMDDPQMEDLCPIGTIAHIKQVLNLPGDSIRVLVEGTERAAIERIIEEEPFILAAVRPKRDTGDMETMELKALVRTTHQFFEGYAKASMRISSETQNSVLDVDRPDQLADIIAANVLTHLEDRQKILEEISVAQRLETLCGILARETELAMVEKQVQARVKKQIEKNQKDYYLREQIKAIQSELGEKEAMDAQELVERLEKTPLNEEAKQKAKRELEKLSHMSQGTPEIGISRNYVEWILDLPWVKTTADNLDLKRARRVLNENHFGLSEVKERIVEYLAVCRMKQDMKGPILCFVGPPGVGKTSIVRAIATAVGRKFVQMSLGGVRDEAEIRGHRRTYIGAIPGRIIAAMKQAGTMNPVFLFDEIDKMSHDFRGDPASAMLEVLDSEQNFAFRDHYLEIPFDLSGVMFITTANSTAGIPAPLLDRMEIIEVPSYTEEEKLQIAKRHLLQKQIKQHGLEEKAVKMTDRVLRMTIEGYTREAGVRTLERTLGKVVRKATVQILDKGEAAVDVSPEVLKTYLGAPKYLRDGIEKAPCVGVANGLAYTSVGGETLAVECSIMQGTGNLSLTGQLGDVMQESAKAALSWVRAHTRELNLQVDFYKTIDIHIHVPQGGVPKDGPSAGVTMTTALVSALTGDAVRQDVAMTGEMTLRGRVLPIGGLKEKTLAAYRAGIRTLIIPKENMKDLEEIDNHVLSRFKIVTVETVDDVLKVALEKKPLIYPPEMHKKVEVRDGN